MDIQIYYAGENAQKVYEPFVPALTAAFKQSTHHSPKWQWDKGNNTLRVLLVTPKDIDPQEGYKEQDWSILIGCSPPITRKSIDVASYLSESTQKLYQILMKSAAAQNGFMYGANFPEAVFANPADITGSITSIAQATLSGNISINNIALGSSGLNIPMAVVALKDELEAPDVTVKDMSSIPAKYLSRLKVDANAHNLFTLGHEIVGHGLQGHTGSAAAKYNCAEINYDVIDNDAIEEAESDIAGVKTLHHTSGLSESEITALARNVGREVEAMRAIANIMQASDLYYTKVASDLTTHISTVHFDPARNDYKGAFANSVDLRGFSSIPPLLVTLSDALNGYVFARTMEDRVKRKDKKLTKFERAFFGEVTKNPAEHLSTFAEYGIKVRYGVEADDQRSEIKQNPAWVVASIRYLKKSGGIEALKAQLRPALRPVVDDIVDDFLRAADTYGSPLLLTDDIRLFERYLPRPMNYKAILAEIMNLQVSKQSKDAQNASLPHDPVPRHILASPRP